MTPQLVRRDVLLHNPGSAGIPDEQLHFPFLFESDHGAWYLTYREGPHLERQFGPGNRVQCVQSLDHGKNWIPWMGLTPEPWLYQFFPSRVDASTLLFCRTGLSDTRMNTDGTMNADAVVFRSADGGAIWRREICSLTRLPFLAGEHLITLWGPVISHPAGGLLWGIMSRENRSISGVVQSMDHGHSWTYLLSLIHI